MKVFLLTLLTAYLLGNGYLYARALALMQGCSLPTKLLFTLLYAVVVFALILSMALRDGGYPAWLTRSLFVVGSAWIVFTLYMILSLTAFDLLHFLFPALKHRFVWACGVTVCLLLYGYYNHRHPRIVELDLKIDHPIDGGEMRFVALSDIHLGEGTGKRALKRYVELINGAKPDAILIAGDLIDNSLAPLYRDRMEEELNTLRAPLGIYLVAGNHEYISRIDKVKAFLEKTKINLLQDSVVTLSNGVQLIGRDDRMNRRRKSLEELLTKADLERPTILLDHQPYELNRTGSLGVDLQISGHTHHGQVWPVSLLTDHIYEQSHGYRRWTKSHIWVSSGISLWGPPFRIGTRGDMAIIRLYNE